MRLLPIISAAKRYELHQSWLLEVLDYALASSFEKLRAEAGPREPMIEEISG